MQQLQQRGKEQSMGGKVTPISPPQIGHEARAPPPMGNACSFSPPSWPVLRPSSQSPAGYPTPRQPIIFFGFFPGSETAAAPLHHCFSAFLVPNCVRREGQRDYPKVKRKRDSGDSSTQS